MAWKNFFGGKPEICPADVILVDGFSSASSEVYTSLCLNRRCPIVKKLHRSEEEKGLGQLIQVKLFDFTD